MQVIFDAGLWVLTQEQNVTLGGFGMMQTLSTLTLGEESVRRESPSCLWSIPLPGWDPLSGNNWHVACGLWHVACGLWPVACGMWHVAQTARRALGVSSPELGSEENVC